MQDIKIAPRNQDRSYGDSGTHWRFGFTPSAEIWNGRLAMIGFLSALLIELFSGQGFLHYWGLY